MSLRGGHFDRRRNLKLTGLFTDMIAFRLGGSAEADASLIMTAEKIFHILYIT